MSTRTLILWRHAKSSWTDPKLDDFDRPLSPRGERAAPQMAAHIIRALPSPDAIICSPAVRTRQTLQPYLARSKHHPPAVIYDQDIYEAGHTVLFSVLRQSIAAKTVLMVGHNPGLQGLALTLLNEPEARNPLAMRMAQKFPTGAVCVFTTSENWGTLSAKSTQFISFTRPKDLDQNTK